ncbi:hypothetical protein M422DRAFT_267766 [Sphaerobolus stellatus SS14]|uniref:Uncharacterized protein n=1 Tax=Sphaerobolus stellatus (strain SS14) TaxID=990650 RepID=A0A0C9TL89_SPHS4|nr:hypothetical protein M422DRAFT_267766 [Sphaerobolus stellatus SS14]
MSMTLIFGNFSVFGAEISQIGKNQHVVYKTSVHTDDGRESFPAYIRTFLPGGSTPLEDNTTVFLYGKLCASCRSPFLIEVINMFCYPGDPTDPFHGAGPSFCPRVSILGHVQNSTDIPTYEGCRMFTLISSAWVRDQLQASAFMAFFDESPRWKKLAVPNKNSCVYVIGALASRDEETQTVRIRIEDITFNAGARSDVVATDGNKANSHARPSAMSAWAISSGSTTNAQGTAFNMATNGANGSMTANEAPSVPAETTNSTTQLQLTGHEQAFKTQPERPKTSRPVSTLPLEQIRSPDDINVTARTERVMIGGRPATPHPWNPEPNEPNQCPPPDASSVPVLSHSKSITSTESDALTTPPPTVTPRRGRPKRKVTNTPPRTRGTKGTRKIRVRRIVESPVDTSSDVTMEDTTPVEVPVVNVEAA